MEDFNGFSFKIQHAIFSKMNYTPIFRRISAVVLLGLALTPLARAESRQVSALDANGWKLWLDTKADWQNDPLFLPPADISKLPVNPPTGGWSQLFAKDVPEADVAKTVADKSLSLDVQVPGTVEEFCWNALSGNQKGLGSSGNYVGVSWWGRDFSVPANAKGKRVKLFFSEGIRQRAEVFVNEKLVGYELVHQTPFEIDVTDAVNFGGANKLAVRITDPNGNFSWGDYTGVAWGKYYFPLSHGFGGILGPVVLKVVEPVHVADIFVKNKPSLTDIDAEIEIANDGTAPLKGTLSAEIVEAWQHGSPVEKPQTVFTSKSAGEFTAAPGASSTVSFSASVPQAKLWAIRDGNLYNLVVTLRDAQGKVIDQATQRFGFRFLSVEGVGTDARLYLNGKRTFFLSAISWGFWPTNGIFPTPELARRHIASAQALGQNMLNFHRCEGNTLVLNTADEMGMLYYEEVGGYSSSRTKDSNPVVKKVQDFDLAVQLNRQRLLRMVKRDRSHPSLVIYNMVNEPGWKPDEQTKKDMASAHLLDPTRMITYGSGFMNPRQDEPSKLHMFPYDQTQHTLGFTDVHNAGNSPGVYTDSMYSSPENFRRDERDEKEIFVWGEEGAVASPPQLELIQQDIAKAGRDGWDGADYKEWYQAYVDYMHDKGLEKYYPSLTKLITSLGDIMYYEHGRLVENVRIADGADLNVLNGYEDMKFDNMSGAVDIFRNLKGDPALINQYMRPLLVAVKARDKVGQVGETNLFDLYVLNEQAIPAGDYIVKSIVIKPDGSKVAAFSGKAHVSGGDKFSDLVTEKVPVVLDGGTGYYKILAELTDTSGKKLATGHDEIFAVDWKSDAIGGRGAVLGGNPDMLRFAREVKKAPILPYDDNLPRLDYVIVGPTDRGDSFTKISPFDTRTMDGKTVGLDLDYYRGKSFDTQIDKRVSTAPVDFDSKSKLIPGYDILTESNYSLRWQGYLVPEVSGPTKFELTADDGARVWLDGKLVVDEWHGGPSKKYSFEANLQAGKPCSLKMEAYQDGGGWEFSLKWKQPIVVKPVDMQRLLKRVREDGTKLLVLEGGEDWVKKLKSMGAFPDFKVFHPSKTWVGSNFFVREHPFFAGLPVNEGMNWEYQRLVVYDGPSHFGLYDMKGKEAIVSLVGGVSHLVATSVGIVPYGKGQIAFSCLDLAPNLLLDDKAAAVPRKIFCNMLHWGATPSQ
jgi:hypothetical protein